MIFSDRQSVKANDDSCQGAPVGARAHHPLSQTIVGGHGRSQALATLAHPTA